MNERYTVAADIGSIRIENSDVVFYFENGMGDGGYTCTVTDRVPDRDSKWHFVGLFNVLRAGTTFLCDYDIGGEPLTYFAAGRYYVYNCDGDTRIVLDSQEPERKLTPEQRANVERALKRIAAEQAESASDGEGT